VIEVFGLARCDSVPSEDEESRMPRIHAAGKAESPKVSIAQSEMKRKKVDGCRFAETSSEDGDSWHRSKSDWVEVTSEGAPTTGFSANRSRPGSICSDAEWVVLPRESDLRCDSITKNKDPDRVDGEDSVSNFQGSVQSTTS
jgi:hypothetical protein